MEGLINVTSDKGVFDISKKEITIPLAEYTDLIAKESVLEQVRYVVERDGANYGGIPVLRAILQIEMSEKE